MDTDRPHTRIAAHTTTGWQIEPSLVYDSLCFLNLLTGDPFYRRYYESEYAQFSAQLAPDAQQALATLRRTFKDQHQMLLGPQLCLYFSVLPLSTIDDLIQAVEQPDALRVALQRTPYFDQQSWAVFDTSRPQITTALDALRKIGFEHHWQTRVLPELRQTIDTARSAIEQYNIVPDVEAYLGAPLDDTSVTVYMLQYAQPHGIKISGMRFISDQSYSLAVTVRSAIHEMMHPPYRLDSDPELRAALDQLRDDPFVIDHFNSHDPAFGYNTFEGLIEESCVRALDQLIGERFGVAKDVSRRWLDEDGGMHVFAVALYSVMRREGYNRRGEQFGHFLARKINDGTLAPGQIEALNRAFYAEHGASA